MAARLASLRAFVSSVRAIEAGGVEPSAFLDIVAPGTIADARVLSRTRALLARLTASEAIDDGKPPADDPEGRLHEGLLARLLGESAAGTVFGVLRGPPRADALVVIAQALAPLVEGSVLAPVLLVPTTRDVVEAGVTRRVNVALDGAGWASNLEALDAAIVPLLNRRAALETARQSVATELAISAEIATALLSAVPASTGGTLTEACAARVASQDALAIERLVRAAEVVQRLGLPAVAVRFAIASPGRVGGFSFARLPAAGEAVADAAVRFGAWRALTDLAVLGRLVTDDAKFELLLAADSRDSWLTALAAGLGIDARTLREVADTQSGASGAKPGADVLRAVTDAARRAVATGTSATLLTWLATEEPKESDAAALEQGARAQLGVAAWRDAARGVHDPVRVRFRDALVAWLLGCGALPDVRDRNTLSGRLLLDVDVDVGQTTTRILHAVSAVQQIVQRVQLGLEPSLRDDAVDAEAWSWRGSYRVWEANRKVFVYPENWIEPELRREKTPLFEELEASLLEGDVTDDGARSALLGYAEDLEEVGLLDIRAVAHTPSDAAVHVVHLFGRTHNPPHAWYHRSYRNRVEWTPWRKLPFDVEGDHLVPAFVGARLIVAWPSFLERLETVGDEEQQSLKVSLTLVEQREGGWGPPRRSKLALTTPSIPKWSSWGPADWLLVGSVVGQELRLDLVDPNGSASAWDRVGSFVVRAPGGPIEVDVPKPPVSEPYHTPYDGFQVGMGLESVTSLGSAGGAWWGEMPKADVFEHTFGQHVLLPTPTRSAWTSAAFPTFVFQDACNVWLALPEIRMERKFITPRPTMREVHRQFGVATDAAEDAGVRTPQRNRTPGRRGDDPEIAMWVSDNPLIARQGLVLHPVRHPYVRAFRADVPDGGVDALLKPANQRLSEATSLPGVVAIASYQPTSNIFSPRPAHAVNFSAGGWAEYHRELFLHGPLLIASRLAAAQRWPEALRWFHHVFDPSGPGSGGPERFWKCELLRGAARDRIQDLLATLSYTGPDEVLLGKRADVEAQIAQWQANPFEPHRIALLRPVAYQKAVVLKYLDTLLAWADELFRRETREAIHEATQLYMLASDILGPRPRAVPPKGTVATKTYATLKGTLDAFSNAVVKLENTIAPYRLTPPSAGGDTGTASALGAGDTLYFCVPPNDRLVGLWDRVEDRLYKARHGLDIDGVPRDLPFFAPPIDPALLVRARANGQDLSAAVAQEHRALPAWRYTALHHRAVEMCNEVRSLGAAMLASLEKKDSEALSALRTRHERVMLDAMAQVRERHVAEATQAATALRQTRLVIEAREAYYKTLPDRIPDEDAHFRALEQGSVMSAASAGYDMLASVVGAIPDITTGAPPDATFGGTHLASIFHALARQMQAGAAIEGGRGSTAALRASWERRRAEWALQRDVIARELKQVDAQISTADIRVQIAEREESNLERQRANAREVEDYLADKFTNADLYGWMLGRLTTVYFQAWRLALDMARRAERAWVFETGDSQRSFVQPNHWDSRHKGLLAGEMLAVDLRRMEAAWVDHARPELELTRRISLASLAPRALLDLKERGRCEFELPEMFFDADHPGHYRRRIRSVALTVPCVAGPYTSINATLTLLSSRVRTTSTARTADAYLATSDFETSFAAVRSIATSHGQADTGRFQLDFRDERYLPFEGAGAISGWSLDMPHDTNAFDFDTLSDIVLQLHYTARDGGPELRASARAARDAVVAAALGADGGRTPVIARQFSARGEFADAWQRFRVDGLAGRDAELVLEIPLDRYPFLLRGRKLEVLGAELVWLPASTADAPWGMTFAIAPPAGGPETWTLATEADRPFPTHGFDWTDDPQPAAGTWRIRVGAAQAAKLAKVKDVILRVELAVSTR